MPTFVVSHSTSSGTNTQALFSAYSTCWCVLKTACACADTQRDTIGYIGTKQEALTRGGVRVTTSTFARAHTLASASLRASCRERPAGTSFYCQHLHSEKQGKRARGDEKCNGRRKRLGSGEQHGSEERKKNGWKTNNGLCRELATSPPGAIMLQKNTDRGRRCVPKQRRMDGKWIKLWCVHPSAPHFPGTSALTRSSEPLPALRLHITFPCSVCLEMSGGCLL